MKIEFIARKQSFNAQRLVVLEDGQREVPMERGTAVELRDGGRVTETVSSFDFYHWNAYQSVKSLGNKTGKLKEGHVEIEYKGQRGVALF